MMPGAGEAVAMPTSPAAGSKIGYKIIIRKPPAAENKEEEAAAPPPHRLYTRSASAGPPLPPPPPERHWDLRPRRKKRSSFFAADQSTESTEEGNSDRHPKKPTYSSPSALTTVSDIPPRRNTATRRDGRKPAPTFRRTLTNEEIEDDLLAMTGHTPRPPKRRKPHEKLIQSNIVLGLDLPKTITGNRYRVSKSSY